jgi:hypothetical protein
MDETPILGAEELGEVVQGVGRIMTGTGNVLEQVHG